MINLKSKIESELNKIVKGKIALLDVPTHRNIGDQLIFEGEMQYIKNNKNCSLDYIASIDSFNEKKIKKNMTLLLHGGGNFNDIWEKHLKFRTMIIEKFPNHKIIILPQTIHFFDKKKLDVISKKYSEHKNLFICVRDKNSYNLIKDKFSNEIIQIPDMAFCIDNQKKELREKNSKVLYIFRNDKESTDILDIDKINNLEIKDWPTFKLFSMYDIKHKVKKIIWLIHNKFNHEKYNVDTFANKVRKEYVTVGNNFLSEYDLVITNRLHGHIYCLILNIPSIMLSNGYGKNENFHMTWLKSYKKSFFAKNQKELNQIMKNNFKQYLK